ncbi:MAG: transporter substrate-binding domain-containing protein [Rhodobacteraceae bacterium]|nr:transporter substrate-binding domain-containing protein [Paracoccaceae bacterium]
MRLLPALLAATTFFSAPVSAQTLERIQETKHFNIGFRSDAAPLSYLDSEGKPSGYSVMICDQIAQALANKFNLQDMRATFVPVDTETRFEKVASGEIDLLCGAATITLGRREIVDFSSPTYVDGVAVLLPKASSSDLRDLAGKKIGFRSDTTTETAVLNSFEGAGIEADMNRFASHQDGVVALANGEIDAYFADQSILVPNYIAAGLTEDFQVSSEILTLEKHGLALSRGDADFRLFVDTVLSEMYADGRMQQFFETALPGIQPGVALEAMFVISPTLP